MQGAEQQRQPCSGPAFRKHVRSLSLSLCLYTKESQKHKQYGGALRQRRRFPGMSVTLSSRVVLEVSLAFDEQDWKSALKGQPPLSWTGHLELLTATDTTDWLNGVTAAFKS